MSRTINIVSKEKIPFTLPTGSGEVGEMDYRDTLAFIAKFAALAALAGGMDSIKSIGAMAEVIVNSKELVEELLTKATGKDAAWVGAQSPRAILALVDAAIELNISEELTELGKTLGLRLKNALAGKTQTETNVERKPL